MPIIVDVRQNYVLPIIGILILIALAGFLIWWFLIRNHPSHPTKLFFTQLRNQVQQQYPGQSFKYGTYVISSDRNSNALIRDSAILSSSVILVSLQSLDAKGLHIATIDNGYFTVETSPSGLLNRGDIIHYMIIN